MLRLASVFTDHAVLQRNKMIPVWGSADPGSLIRVTLNDQTAWAKATQSGRFRAYLPESSAGGPYKLTVTSGSETLELDDIMIGEVWLAGGQSNMQYTLGANWTLPGAENVVNAAQLQEFIESLSAKKVFRMFTVPRVTSATEEETVDAAWIPASPETVDQFSAVASWFARYVQEGLEDDVPFGILSSSWGGTIAEAWTSSAALLQNPVTAAEAGKHLQQFSCEKNLNGTWKNRDMADLFAEIPGVDSLYGDNEGEKNGWAEIDFDDHDWKLFIIPGSWIVQEIAKNGILWVRIPVDIPEDWAGRELLLRPGAIDKTDITYFNGRPVGSTGGRLDVGAWNVMREYKVPAELVRAGRNMIAIRALSFASDGNINGETDQMYLECPELDQRIFLAGGYKAKAEKEIDQVNHLVYQVCYAVNNPNVYGVLFDSMIYPLLPYGIRGVIWYQGESNAPDACHYANILGTMIRDWRFRFMQGDLPFIQVELANYGKPAACKPFLQNWAFLREQQQMLCRDMKNVFLVSAIDVGDAGDIHPHDKKSVGRRLADNALHHVYGKTQYCPNGPVFKQAQKEKNTVRIAFDFADGLKFAEGSPAGQGFFLAGADKNVFPADHAEIEGDTVLLSSQAVAEPRYVWYSWSTNPNGNLRNRHDLPAHSFRVDLASLDS